MAIDTGGKWWRGETVEDLADYLRALTADAYPADEIRRCVCAACGSEEFLLRIRAEEGGAMRTCAHCGSQHFIADSEQTWGRAKGTASPCPVCKHAVLNVVVGFSLRQNRDVRWVTVAERCVACGVLGSSIDWGVSYGPSHDLVERA